MNEKLLEYVAFLSRRDKKSLTQKALKTAEECGEIARAVLPFENAYATTHRIVERTAILEECIDTTLCALSIAYDLGYNNEDIEQMMHEKSKVWAKYQQKEDRLKYPVPYEIHITVNIAALDELASAIGADPSAVRAGQLDEFKEHCAVIGVKPILLDLQNQQGITVMPDLMTSSKHFGDNTSALTEMCRITDLLGHYGYKVIREKIETVPWHPAAPNVQGDKMPPNCYFEAHFAVVTTEDKLPTLTIACANHDLHLSRNVFKRNDDGTFVIMATLRAYEGFGDKFSQRVEDIRFSLNETYGFAVSKTHVEFSMYDTSVSHDTSWITN